jgi:hypothetical protein
MCTRRRWLICICTAGPESSCPRARPATISKGPRTQEIHAEGGGGGGPRPKASGEGGPPQVEGAGVGRARRSQVHDRHELARPRDPESHPDSIAAGQAGQCYRPATLASSRLSGIWRPGRPWQSTEELAQLYIMWAFVCSILLRDGGWPARTGPALRKVTARTRGYDPTLIEHIPPASPILSLRIPAPHVPPERRPPCRGGGACSRDGAFSAFSGAFSG